MKRSTLYRLQNASQKSMLVVNFLFWGFSLAIIVYLAWISIEDLDRVIDKFFGSIVDYVLIWVMLGGMYITGMVGYLGAVRVDIKVLKAYLWLIGLFLLLELSFITYYSITVPPSTARLQSFEDWMQMDFDERSEREKKYQCCGYNGLEDYQGEVPFSCFYLPPEVNTTLYSGFELLAMMQVSEVGCGGTPGGAEPNAQKWTLIRPMMITMPLLQVAGVVVCLLMFVSVSTKAKR